MKAYLELLTVFAIQLFIIVDPLACIPIFLAITPGSSRSERRRLARRSCLIAFVVLTFFLLAGAAIIGYFGIGMPAIQICGGVLLFLIALEFLHGHPTKTETTHLEERLAGEKEDVSVTPLAIPLLAGPGAIATSMVFAGRANTVLAYLTLVAGAGLVFVAVYACLHWADNLARMIGVLGMRVITRIMGFLLAFIGIQYVIDGIRDQFFP
ncbi:MarC family protein [Geobacter sp. SVR]|uniref:MarC family protein n=1 Tax=Geobacter sp. SVR TaxID=2495594 RepID=UPI00143EF7C5|nr:MarC family protein [Geobacter sp. SVR]BCS53461.1 UPF0056 inner membrane protein [Geobacter sp. SVR]GCF85412.1 UPF0056 inner membrane protein [Geobacter sp. SVR]